MGLVIRNIVVLNVKFVYVVLPLECLQLANYIGRASAPQFTSPKIGGCTKSALRCTAPACVDLAYTMTDGVGRLISPDCKVFLHVVEMPGWIRDIVDLSPMSFTISSLALNQHHGGAGADLVGISNHSVADPSHVPGTIQGFQIFQKRGFGFSHENRVQAEVLY